MPMATHFVVQQQSAQQHAATLQQHQHHQELLYTSSAAPSVAINTCASATQAVSSDVGKRKLSMLHTLLMCSYLSSRLAPCIVSH